MHDKAEFVLETKRPIMECMLSFFDGDYSTSKHLLVLYSMAVGVNAQNIIEVGSGRSTIALCCAADKTGGHVTTCDNEMDMFGYTHDRLTTKRISGIKYLNSTEDNRADFVFLDCFSSRDIGVEVADKYINESLRVLRPGGVLAVHDAMNKDYSIHRVWSWRGFFFLPYNYSLGVVVKDSEKLGYSIDHDSWTKDRKVK